MSKVASFLYQGVVLPVVKDDCMITIFVFSGSWIVPSKYLSL